MSQASIWFLNRSYWPDTEASGQLLTELCEDLASDFQVTVFAGQPNHVQSSESLLAEGDVSPESHSRRGVGIVRVPHTRFNKHSTVGRLVNLMSFTIAAFVSTLFRTRPEIVVTETDPFFLPLLGRWLKFRDGCHFVAYLQDVYPDVAIAVGRASENPATRFLRNRLVAAYERSDRVVVVSDGMRSRCIRNGVSPHRITVVHNWADCRRITPVKINNEFREKHQWNDRFLVTYSGNLGMAHSLMPIIEAAIALKHTPDIHFVFIGEGAHKQALVDRVTEERLTNVTFLPYQPREFLSQSLSAADVQIIALRSGTQGCVMPSKLYGVLAAGTPIVALSPEGDDLSRIVREFDIGRACSIVGDDLIVGLRLANILSEMRADPARLVRQGEAARELIEQHFDRPRQVNRMANVLKQVLQGEDGPTIQSPASARNPLGAPPVGMDSTEWRLLRQQQSQRDTSDMPSADTDEYDVAVSTLDDDDGPTPGR